jgi:hypothetical protein
MPYTWMTFSTMTTPLLEGKSPRQIRDEIAGLVGDRLIEVYFDIGKEVGYALCKDLGGSADIKYVSRQLGGLGVTKMLDADQAEGVLAPDAGDGV